MTVSRISPGIDFSTARPGLISILNGMPGSSLFLLPNAPGFTILGATDEYLSAQNLQRENIIGKTMMEVFFEDDRNNEARDQLLASLGKVLKDGREDHMPDQIYNSSYTVPGTIYTRIWRPINRPILDDNNQITCIIHSVIDVTESHQLMEIAEANKYLQSLINLFKEPLQILEPVFKEEEIIDFRYKYTNEAYARYTNSNPETIQGKLVSEIFPGYFDTISFSKPVETYKTGQPQEFEIHYNQDGLDLYNQMSTTLLADGDIAISFIDFTHLKKLQIELENKVSQLRTANQQLEDFAYGASHDLKEPVRKIRIFSDRLAETLRERLTEKEHILFDRIDFSIIRIQNLIDALLEFHAADNQIETPELLDLDEVLQQVLLDLDLQLEQQKGIVKAEPLCKIYGRRRQWEQVFQNLLGNALKYVNEGVAPVIEICCKEILGNSLPHLPSPEDATRKFYLISIKDNGIGFSQEDAERIFTVFTRLHSKAGFEGSGVGLATVRTVVNQQGGITWATGSPKEGATFYIAIPV